MTRRPAIAAAVLAGVLLAACAGTPPRAEVQRPAAPTQAAAPASAAAPAPATTSATQYPGYKRVVRNGQTLYCSTSRTLGSWIKTDTVCMTEQELISAREQSQRSMMDISQKNGAQSH
jgi:invasion protein IalB